MQTNLSAASYSGLLVPPPKTLHLVRFNGFEKVIWFELIELYSKKLVNGRVHIPIFY